MKVDITSDQKYLVLSTDYIFELNVIRNALTREIPNAWLLKKITSIQNTDRVFINSYNMVPTGLWLELIKICKDNNINVEMTEKTQEYIKSFQLDFDTFKQYVLDLFEGALDDKGNKFMPYDYQIEAAYTVLKYRKCCTEISTSGGKTLISFIVFKYLMDIENIDKILYIVPSVDLANQSAEQYELYESFLTKHSKEWTTGVLRANLKKAEKEAVENCNILFGTFQSLCKRDHTFFNKFEGCISDECLDKDTLITMYDGTKKKISDIKAGDIVKTYNENNKTIEEHEVEYVYKGLSKNNKLYKIVMEDNTELIITGNHKVLTNNGWKRVDELNKNDDILSYEH